MPPDLFAGYVLLEWVIRPRIDSLPHTSSCLSHLHTVCTTHNTNTHTTQTHIISYKHTHTLHTMYTDTRHMHTLHTVYIDTTHTPTHRSFWHPQFTEHKGPHRSWAYELEEGILALKPLVALGITASLWEWGVLLGLSKWACAPSCMIFGLSLQGNKIGSVQAHPDSALVHTPTKAKKRCQNLYAPRINWKVSLLKAKASREKIWVNYKWFLYYQSFRFGCGPLRRSWSVVMDYSRAPGRGWWRRILFGLSESDWPIGVTFDRTEICVFSVGTISASRVHSPKQVGSSILICYMFMTANKKWWLSNLALFSLDTSGVVTCFKTLQVK